jgi:hypothetical protein
MKIPKSFQKACQLLIGRVRFSHASFKLGDNPMSNDQDTELIRAATRLYVETWIVPVIEMIQRGDIKGLREHFYL